LFLPGSPRGELFEQCSNRIGRGADQDFDSTRVDSVCSDIEGTQIVKRCMSDLGGRNPDRNRTGLKSNGKHVPIMPLWTRDWRVIAYPMPIELVVESPPSQAAKAAQQGA
jgi:hypothetical protein